MPDPNWIANLGTFEVMRKIIFEGGQVYIGGGFTTLGGVPPSNLAKVSSTGPASIDANWAPIANSDVNALAFGAGNSIFISGDFTQINAQPRRHLAKLTTLATGTLDTAWTPEVLGPSPLNALLVNTTGNIVLGGHFSEVGAHLRQGIAALPPVLSDLIFRNGIE